jgi:DNA-binding CsgD family transcriptional regulator/PAS domain-containing protein
MTLDTAAPTGLITTLYSAPLQPELWNVFLAQFACHCRVTKAALITHDFENSEHRILAAFGDTIENDDNTRDYQTRFWECDEWTLRSPKIARPGAILRGAEIWPEESFLKSVFYNEFLKRVDVCEMAALFGAKYDGGCDALSLFRGPHEASLDDEQLALLQSIAPHLQAALAVRHRLSGLESRISDLETALDQLQTALVLIDAKGRPVLANQAARHICDQPNSLRLSAQRLTALDPTENSRLSEIITRAISACIHKSGQFGGATLISRPGKRPLQILAAPFFSQSKAFPRGAVAVVFISDPEQKPAVLSEILHTLYGLTEAESRLAISLLDGKSLAEAADSIGVGRETVRSQIKSALHKTGTARQGEMIRLLSSIPC